MLIGYLLENTFFFELNDEFYQVMTHNQWVLFASAILMRHMGQLVIYLQIILLNNNQRQDINKIYTFI